MYDYTTVIDFYFNFGTYKHNRVIMLGIENMYNAIYIIKIGTYTERILFCDATFHI